MGMRKRLNRLFMESAAVFVWIFVLAELLTFNLGWYVFHDLLSAPNWVASYRLVWLALIITLVWALLGHKKFFLLFGYIVVYPFIIFVWRIPKTLLKRSRFAFFVYSNGILNFLANLRARLLAFSIFLLSIILIFHANSAYVLVSCMALLLILLLVHYYKRVKTAFSPLSLFVMDSKTLQDALESESFQRVIQMGEAPGDSKELADTEAINRVKSGSQPEDSDIESQLLQLVFVSRFFTFSETTLRTFQRTRIYLLFTSLSLIATYLFTIVVGGLLNYATFKINPLDYSLQLPPNLFNFVYYAFNAAALGHIQGIMPSTTFSRGLFMFQGLLTFLILSLMVTLIFTTMTERFKDELSQMTGILGEQQTAVTRRLQAEFKMSVGEAVGKIAESSPVIAKFLRFLAQQSE